MAIAFYIIIMIVFVLFGKLQTSENLCGDKCLGETVPKGDIKLISGTDLKIICRLYKVDHQKKQNASFLSWSVASLNEYDHSLNKYITVLNENSAQLFIPNVTVENSDFYSCHLNNTPTNSAVSNNDVKIGYKASADIPFGCKIVYGNFNNNISDNKYPISKMHCFWEPPKNNKISTKYLVFYKRNRSLDECKENESSNKTYCIVNEEDIPRQDEIHVEFHASNYFAKDSREYKFIKCQHVIFKDEPYIKYNNMSSEVEVEFSDLTNANCNNSTVICQINLKNTSETQKFSVENISGKNKCRYRFGNLTPYSNYTIEVSCRLKNSSFPDEWSPIKNLSFISNSEVPFAPSTTSGSFVNHENGSYTVYWKPIPAIHYNGPNFLYGLQCGNISLGNTTVSHFTILDLQKQCSGNKNFTIYSENNVGKSKEVSSLYIADRPLPIITKLIIVYVEANDTYKVSWRNESNGFYNFTVFWCEIQNCTNLNWAKTSDLTINLHLSKGNYQFAVSSQSDLQSSGIQWEDCILPEERGKESPQNVKSLISNDNTITWEFPCKRRSEAVEGFVVHWSNDSYKDKSKVLDIFRREYSFSNLDPGIYFIQVETIIKGKSNIFTNSTITNLPKLLPHLNDGNELQSIVIVLIVISSVVIVAGCFFVVSKKIKVFPKVKITLPSGLYEESNTNPNPSTDPLSSSQKLRHEITSRPLMKNSSIHNNNPSPSPCGSQSSGIGSVTTSEVEDQNQHPKTSSESELATISSVESVSTVPVNSEILSNDYEANVPGKNFKMSPFNESDQINSNSFVMPNYSMLGNEVGLRDSVLSDSGLVPNTNNLDYMKVGLQKSNSGNFLDDKRKPLLNSVLNNSEIIFNDDDLKSDSINLDSMSCSKNMDVFNLIKPPIQNNSFSSPPGCSVNILNNPHKNVNYVSNVVLNIPCETRTPEEVSTTNPSIDNMLGSSYAIIGGSTGLNCSNNESNAADSTNVNFKENAFDAYLKIGNADCERQEFEPLNVQKISEPHRGYVTADQLASNVTVPEYSLISEIDNDKQNNDNEQKLKVNSDYVSRKSVSMENETNHLDIEEMPSNDGLDELNDLPLTEDSLQHWCTNLFQDLNANQNSNKETLKNLHLTNS